MNEPENERTFDEQAKKIVCNDRAMVAWSLFKNRDGEAWVPREYQLDSLRSQAKRKIHCDGRDVGKTSEIEITAVWAMLSEPGKQMLIATQTQNHLRPLMDRVARMFETHPLLKEALVEIRRTPSWFLRFQNNFILWGRIAGPRGINFQGLHVDYQIVDEAQEMTEQSWNELYQALNANGTRWVYGVPNGLRNAFYKMNQDPACERHHWPSRKNPDFTDAKDAELAQLYGGRTAPAYIHRVLGRHGAPAQGVFNLDDYQNCIDDSINFTNLELTPENWGLYQAKGGTTEARGLSPIFDRSDQSDQSDTSSPSSSSYASSTSIPSPSTKSTPSTLLSPNSSPLSREAHHLGCDLGFARDPSEFVVYRVEEPYLINVARIRLTGVNYARQLDVIRELDAAYHFHGIAIDAGNNGRAIAHQLMAIDDHWCARVRCIDFAATVELEPLPDGSLPRRNQKEFMTELLVRRMAERTIKFPPLDERETQYANHTYSIGQHGRVLYDKLNDHLIDADRCALMSHYLSTKQELPRTINKPLVRVYTPNTNWLNR